jgi:hypothetical protein
VLYGANSGTYLGNDFRVSDLSVRVPSGPKPTGKRPEEYATELGNPSAKQS